MAIGIENYPNNGPTNTDYPYGQINDNDGSGNGTPVNKLVYDDIHQNFRRLMSLSGETPNNMPDNVSNGYQYVSAMKFLYRNFRGATHTSTDLILDEFQLRKIIYVEGTSSNINVSLPSSSLITDSDSIVIYNNSDNNVIVIPDTYDEIMNNSSITLIQKGDYVELVLDKSSNNWIIANYKITSLFSSYTPTLYCIDSSNANVVNGFTGTISLAKYKFENNNLNLHFELTGVSTLVNSNLLGLTLPITIPSPYLAVGNSTCAYNNGATSFIVNANCKLLYTGAGYGLVLSKSDGTDFGAHSGGKIRFSIQIAFV